MPQYPEVELGARLCVRIKQLFHPNTPYSEIVMDGAKKLSRLKEQARVCFPHKNTEEILREVGNWSDADLIDLITLLPTKDGDAICNSNGNQQSVGGMLTRHFTETLK